MSFNLIAECYDLLSNPTGRLKKEGPLFKKLVNPQDNVLDLACGTGPQALFLAKECDAIVDAHDLSPDMIEYASTNRCHKNINYAVKDMTLPHNKNYDLIICVGNSINLLPSRDLVQQTINNALNSLKPNGVFIIHIINPLAPQHQQAKKIHKTEIVDGQEISITKILTPHKNGRNLHITYKPASGDIIEESSTLLDLNKDELENMLLKSSSIYDIKIYGTLDLDEYETSSPDVLMVVNKK